MEINPATLTGPRTQSQNQSQNLINPNKVSSSAGTEGFWRSIVIDFLSIASALCFGWFYFRYLSVASSPWYLFAAFLLFSACSALQVFLAKGIGRRTLVIFGESVALIACFLFYDSWLIAGIAGLVAFAVLLWGYFASRSALRGSIEVQFFRIARSVLGKVVTALVLVMILVYVPQAESQGQPVFVARGDFHVFFDWAAGVVNGFYPNVPLAGSFGTFAENIARTELAQNPAFGSLNQSEQNKTVAQAAAQLTASVAQTTKIAPAPDETVSDVAYDYLVATLVGLRDHFQTQFIAVWAIILFFILRSIGIAFVWVAEFASLIVYEILLATGFMHIDKITQTQEVITY
ncbi:MAG: hypothetical protein ABSE18_03810 [Minisyncoccia bacterium]